MIGLAAVLLLIGLAAAIFSTASRDRPVLVAGGARPDIVANLTGDNGTAPAAAPTNEPLAELGVTPSTASEEVNATALSEQAPARHRDPRR